MNFEHFHDQLLNIEKDTDENHLVDAARSRLLELETIIGALTGKGKAWDKRLSPMTHAVDDFILGLDNKLQEPINYAGENSADELHELIVRKEEIEQLLNQARIAALCMLANLNAAILKFPK